MSAIIVMNCEHALALFFQGPGERDHGRQSLKDIKREIQNGLMNLKKRGVPSSAQDFKAWVDGNTACPFTVQFQAFHKLSVVGFPSEN